MDLMCFVRMLIVGNAMCIRTKHLVQGDFFFSIRTKQPLRSLFLSTAIDPKRRFKARFGHRL